MELETLPCIDWEKSIKVIGKKEFAEQMIAALIKRLPDEIAAIKQSHRAQNYSEMWGQVHKLNGALCYCVLPRLKSITEQLESNLKNNIMKGSSSLLDQLDKEVRLLLNDYSSSLQHI